MQFMAINEFNYVLLRGKIMKSESRTIKVTIFGKDYEVKGSTDEKYVENLANYVDSVMRDISKKSSAFSSSSIAILAALNIADEMFKERQQFKEYIEGLERELKNILNITSEISDDNN